MKKLRKLHFTRAIASVTALGVLAGLLMSAGLVLFKPKPVKAQAAGVFAWVNAGTITSGGRVYYDTHPGDDIHWFVNQAAGNCTYSAGGLNNVPNDRILLTSLNQGTQFIVSPNIKDEVGRIKCEAPSVSMTGTGQSAAYYVMYRSGDNLVRTDGTTMFSKVDRPINMHGTTNGELFVRVGEVNAPCPDVVIHGTNGDYNGWFIIPASRSKDFYSDEQTYSGHYIDLGLDKTGTSDCRTAYRELFDPVDDGGPGGLMGLGSSLVGNDKVFLSALGEDGWKFQFGVPDASVAGPPAGSTPPAQADGPTDEGPPTACDISFNFATALGLKWIICPIINILMSTTAWLEDFLTSQLITNTDPLKPDSPYHAVWGSFRTLALAIIIVVALVMVIFEATGVEAFSAYTVRTLFTRFGVAVLFIVLSWSILSEVVVIVNTITEGARALIYSPFQGHLPAGDLSGGASLILALLGTGGILALGPWGLISFVLTAVLSVFVTVIVLVIVHAIIYVLIMVAPVAIALSVLPNTRKGYEFWKNALASMFIGLVAVAFAMPALDVIAASTYNLEGGSTLNQIIALIIKIMRPFVVLFVFSRVGGALGTITGMVNDRSRGAFDRLKKFRSDTMRSRHQERMEGGAKVFGSNNLAAGYRRVANAREGGLSVMQRGRSRYSAYEQKVQAGIQAKRLEDDHGRAGGNDDANEIASQDGMNRNKFIQAYMQRKNLQGNYHTAADAEKALAELEAGYGAQVGTKSFQGTAARALFASNTAFAPKKGAETKDERDANYRAMIETATRLVNNGTMSSADATAMIKSNRSRPDMNGISFGSLMGQIDRSVERSQGAAYQASGDARELITNDEVSALRRTVLRGTNPGAMVGQRHEAVTSLAPEMLTELQEAQASGDNQRFQRELAAIAGRYDAMAQIAPQNAEIMASEVLGKTIQDRNGNNVTVQALIEQVRSGVTPDGQKFDTQEWDNMRRDFKQQGISTAQAQQMMEAQQRGGMDPTQGPPTPGGPSF